MSVSAVYVIRNRDNGNMYIGSAYDYVKRRARHFWELTRGTHHSEHLQRAYDKYGRAVFESDVVEYVDDKDQLLKREQVWIDFFKPAYNVAKVAGSPTKGLKFSAETREKMAAAHRGRKRPPRPVEWNQKISATKKLRGMSPDGLASLRAKHIVRFSDPAYRERWAKARTGIYRHPEEFKRRAAERMKGNTYSKGYKFPPGAYESRRKRRVS